MQVQIISIYRSKWDRLLNFEISVFCISRCSWSSS